MSEILPAQKTEIKRDSSFVNLFRAIGYDGDVDLSSNAFQEVVRDAWLEYPRSPELERFKADVVLANQVQIIISGKDYQNDLDRLYKRVQKAGYPDVQKDAIFQLFDMIQKIIQAIDTGKEVV